MADHLRRAARQPAYEVHEILEGNPALDLGVRFVSADYLDEHDPTRTGAVSGVEILRVRDEGSEIVWRYGHSQMRPPEDLVAVWGFEPTQSWFRRDAAA